MSSSKYGCLRASLALILFAGFMTNILDSRSNPWESKGVLINFDASKFTFHLGNVVLKFGNCVTAPSEGVPNNWNTLNKWSISESLGNNGCNKTNSAKIQPTV